MREEVTHIITLTYNGKDYYRSVTVFESEYNWTFAHNAIASAYLSEGIDLSVPHGWTNLKETTQRNVQSD